MDVAQIAIMREAKGGSLADRCIAILTNVYEEAPKIGGAHTPMLH
jgi:hypothetical protein